MSLALARPPAPVTACPTACDPVVWVLPDRRPGNASQCLGVAEALGWPFQVKPLGYTWAVRIANRLRGVSLLGLDRETRASFTPPWPDIVIAAGRRAAPAARWIKRESGGRSFLLQMMHPGPFADEFDLIVRPDHDRFHRQPNLLPVIGAPHHATAAKMADAVAAWRERLEHLPRPLVTLLIGGSYGRRKIDAAEALALVGEADDYVRRLGGSLLLTTSRRTPREVCRVLPEAIRSPAWIHTWQRHRENPYFAFLGMSDVVLVTGDSVSMCCEATATGKPVFVVAPPGLAREIHRRFHQRLFAIDAARPWDHRGDLSGLADWTAALSGREPVNAARTIAQEVYRRLGISPKN